MHTLHSLWAKLVYPDKKVFLTKAILYLVNLGTIVYFSVLINSATNLISSRFDARVFLERLRSVPVNPLRAAFLALVFFFLIVLLEILRSLFAGSENSGRVQFALFFVYAALCVAIMYFLNVGNKGILMIPAIHAITFVNRRRQKAACVIVVLVLYIVLDQDLAASALRVVPLDVFIGYYPADAKLRMFAVKTVLFSLNEILFIVFMVAYVQLQIAERNRVQELYDRLNMSLYKLQVANVQLVEYAKKSEEMAKLKERNRLAREIHDTIGHTLTGIEIGLKACLCLPAADGAAVFDQVGKVYELARQGSRDVRFSLKELRPDALQRNTLLPALESLVRQMNECTRSHSYLVAEDEIPELSGRQEELMYRIVQESMTNAVGHGEASEIEIRIGYDGENVCMSIADNGMGTDELREGFGLTNIRQRAESFGGRISVETAAGKGFCLSVTLPLSGGTGP